MDASKLRDMPDQLLIAQDLVQQGAVHAVSYLLKHGCTEELATQMLASLRQNTAQIREEAERRGTSLFAQDQVAFD
ncbi:hypothetical protein [Burkholderia gladioli]|uniref:hypothetical protein n=1 Tax=Burkholderia gladioli TaxID=28095 RepID=UPI001FC7C373|nr:hypothetical protein [Burkholderia gladioli]